MNRLSAHFSCLLMLIVTGCQTELATPKATGPVAAETTPGRIKVTLALNWFPEAEHGGFYAALVHNYFEEEGLEVTIRPGGPKVPVIVEVANGKMEFGVDNADKLLLARAQQADVVAVMNPIQNSPRCVMVHKKSGITRLEDLAGRKPFTLAMNSGQPFAQFLTRKINLTDAQVVPYQGNVARFLEDPNCGQQAYSFSEPFAAERHQGDPLCLMMSDIGFNTYTSVLLTRRVVIEKQPELVTKMTRASIRGWKKYLAEPEQTNQYIHEQNSELGLDVLAFGAAALRPLCFPAGFDENRLGEMTAERWQTLVSQMTDIKLLAPDSVHAEDAYSLKFLSL